METNKISIKNWKHKQLTMDIAHIGEVLFVYAGKLKQKHLQYFDIFWIPSYQAIGYTKLTRRGGRTILNFSSQPWEKYNKIETATVSVDFFDRKQKI